MPLFSSLPKFAVLRIDQRAYHTVQFRRSFLPDTAPRLVIVSYLPNELAYHTLRVCVQAIQRFTPEPHEIWVIDNYSPWKFARHLLSLPGINLVFNRTEPLPPESRKKSAVRKNWAGSYANALALEISVRLVDPATRYLMTMHMDVLPCKTGWLSFLQSKLNHQVRAAGVRLDIARVPEGVLHVLGYMVDFQLFRELSLTFFPRLTDENCGFDVGDLAIVAIRQAGYDIYACPNSLHDKGLIESLPENSHFRSLNVDRSFDEVGDVIYLHLGRGVLKSSGNVIKGSSTEEWIKFADEALLAP